MRKAESYLVRREIYQNLRIDEFVRDNAELTLNSGSARWIELVRAWEIALDLAQSGQNKIIHSMHECYLGAGVNPSVEQMNMADELWAAERQARAAIDEFISERFG